MDNYVKTAAESDILDCDDVAQFLKYEDDEEAENTLIDNMIAEVRDYFERATGLSFVSKTYITYFRHDDKPYILPVSPVIAIVKVETVDIDGTTSELTENSDYYKKGMHEVEIITDASSISNPFRTFAGKYDLKVEYTAGYGHASTGTLPASLLGAVKKQLLQWYDNRDDYNEYKILGSIEKVLNLHRRRWL